VPAIHLSRCFAIALLSLTAASCDDDGSPKYLAPGQQAAGRATATLASTIAGAPDLAKTGQLLAQTGLAQVLDGVGSYTMLAPSDDAYRGTPLDVSHPADADESARIAAVLRHHILPGYITLQDLERAIDRYDAGFALMRTLDGGVVRFAREGDAITVTDLTGGQARLAPEQRLAVNGVALPIERVLSPDNGTGQ